MKITATEFWEKKFGEKPQTDVEKLAVAMMAEYGDYLSHPLENFVSKPTQVMWEADKEKRLQRLDKGYSGQNVEEAYCPICKRIHTLWVHYDQLGKCVIVECRNNVVINGRWAESNNSLSA